VFLSNEELRELSGYQKRSAQMRWLEAQGIAFLIGGDGVPKVLRSVVIARLGGTTPVEAKPKEPQLRLPPPVK
jgi:hypothetical protein